MVFSIVSYFSKQAEQLKARQEAGENLLAEQLDKITKIDELQLELDKIKLV